MKKRVLAAIMTAAMICTGLAGCGGNASGSTDASGKAEKKTKITMLFRTRKRLTYIRQHRNSQTGPVSILTELWNLRFRKRFPLWRRYRCRYQTALSRFPADADPGKQRICQL